MDWTSFLIPFVEFAVILVLTTLLALLTGGLIGRAMRRSSPQATAGARRFGIVIVGVTGGILAIQQLGVSPAILLLVVGLLGVAALVACRQQLENLGAKYFADLYVPFKLGDRVQVGAHAGKVIEINAMCTVLLTEQDQLVSVPNSHFLREVILNTSPQAWKELVVPLTIGTGVDLPAFESEVLKSLGKLRLRLDPRFPPVLTTKARSPQGTDLVLTVMIRRPEEREALLAEVHQRVTEAQERVAANR
jgi:small conductance mechanosensitive channel